MEIHRFRIGQLSGSIEKGRKFNHSPLSARSAALISFGLPTESTAQENNSKDTGKTTPIFSDRADEREIFSKLPGFMAGLLQPCQNSRIQRK
ncbi:MAG: hypothetical protein JSS81_05065 [Acidobacteria bacterium]|nr:hypothetical protein [Acidobacteriota bacterium]